MYRDLKIGLTRCPPRGLCALIQAETSTGAIEFDYAGYAEKRLKEYCDWRRVHDGNVDANEGISQREERWAAP